MVGSARSRATRPSRRRATSGDRAFSRALMPYFSASDSGGMSGATGPAARLSSPNRNGMPAGMITARLRAGARAASFESKLPAIAFEAARAARQSHQRAFGDGLGHGR